MGVCVTSFVSIELCLLESDIGYNSATLLPSGAQCRLLCRFITASLQALGIFINGRREDEEKHH